MNARMTIVQRRMATLAAGAMLAGAAACADKDLTTPARMLNPRVSLSVETRGIESQQQQAGFQARFLLVIGGYQAANDIEGLGYVARPLAQGTQNVTLDLDLSRCLADGERPGSRESCTIFLAAALVADTVGIFSDSGDAFDSAFDLKIIGPFVVAPGRPAPTIPAIDLSATRYAAVRFTGDEALRAGGPLSPQTFTGATAGFAPASGPPIIYGLSAGPPSFSQTSQPQQFFPQLAIFQNGGWNRVTAVAAPPGTSFRQATALAANEVYLAHPNGLFLYDGSSISRVTQVAAESLLAVGSVSLPTGGKLVIAAGPNGVTWIGHGTTWTRRVAFTGQRFDGACINGPNEAFVSSLRDGSIFHFNGTNWASVPAPATAGKGDLQCTGPGQAFVWAQAGPLFRWNGSGWTNLPLTGLNNQRLITMAAVSPTEIYGVGDSAAVDRAFYRFDGTQWNEIGRARFTQGSPLLFRPWADPRGGAVYYLTSFGRLERAGQGGVTVLSYHPSLRDAWVNSASSAFVVGWNSFLARWDGTRWNVDAPPPRTQTVRILQGVWSDGPANAWAVGGGSTVYRWNGTAWTVVSDLLQPMLGQAQNYNAVFGLGQEVWLAGDNSIIRCAGAGGCAAETNGGGAIYSVWGTTATNLWAVGSGGRILQRTGAGWAAVPSPTTRALVRVHGSAPDNVWAVGDSVLVRFNGTQWVNVPLLGDDRFLLSRAPSSLFGVIHLGLLVRSANEVYIGGDFGEVRMFNGFDSKGFPFFYRRRIMSIAASPDGCTLMVTEDQSDTPPPALWRGEGGAGCFLNPMTPPTSWP